MMAELPTERFKEAVLTAVKMNERFIPPYESGASLYIRPLLIMFLLMCTAAVLKTPAGQSPPPRKTASQKYPAKRPAD